MNITLLRVHGTQTVTLGILKTPWGDFTTCEDADRPTKIKGITCIPAGTYEIKLRTKSGMATNYRSIYGNNHKGMIWLQDVPNFEFIYIHHGNTPLDTDGCVLVGQSMDISHGSIGSSRNAYREIYPEIMRALERNEHVDITIKDLV